jgi:hypothetical protein
MRRLAGAVLAPCLTVTCAVGLAACSGSKGASDAGSPATTPITCDPASAAAIPSDVVVPDVAAVTAAVAAVEAAAGGPQQYFEVNADAQVVNVFVAVPGSGESPTHAVRYTYVGGTLAPSPADLGEADGATFAAAALTFQPATVLRCAHQALPQASLARFVAVGLAAGGVQYSIDAVSELGGELEVDVGPAGAVQGIGPAS